MGAAVSKFSQGSVLRREIATTERWELTLMCCIVEPLGHVKHDWFDDWKS